MYRFTIKVVSFNTLVNNIGYIELIKKKKKKKHANYVQPFDKFSSWPKDAQKRSKRNRTGPRFSRDIVSRKTIADVSQSRDYTYQTRRSLSRPEISGIFFPNGAKKGTP